MSGIAGAGQAGADGCDRNRSPTEAGAGPFQFAATPLFALMALVTATQGLADPLCSTMHGAAWLGGMTPMYMLMGALHSRPWLDLMVRPRDRR